MTEQGPEYIVLVIWEDVETKLGRCTTFYNEDNTKSFIVGLIKGGVDIQSIEVLKSYDFPNRVDITF